MKSLNENLEQIRSTSVPRRKFAFKKPAPKVGFTKPHNIASENASISAHEGDDLKCDVSSLAAKDVPTKSEILLQLLVDTESAHATEKQSHNAISTSSKSSTIASADIQNIITVDSLSSAHYILDPSVSHSESSASVTSIHHSVVELSNIANRSQHLATLAVKSVRNSLLLCGRVSGAAHITGAHDSAIIIWSRQVRLHECKDCVVYLRCTSRPIIEHCESIKFAPLPECFVSAL